MLFVNTFRILFSTKHSPDTSALLALALDWFLAWLIACIRGRLGKASCVHGKKDGPLSEPPFDLFFLFGAAMDDEDSEAAWCRSNPMARQTGLSYCCLLVA